MKVKVTLIPIYLAFFCLHMYCTMNNNECITYVRISARCCFGQTQLFGKTLNVSVFGVPPYITFDPATKSLGGVDVDLLKILAGKFKFRPKIVGEKTWAAFINGTWFGTVGSVSIYSFVTFNTSTWFQLLLVHPSTPSGIIYI